jgi:hypothetical protein
VAAGALHILQRVDGALHCPVCSNAIGVYEPVVAFYRGDARTTSLAKEPALGSGEETVVHRACAGGWLSRELRKPSLQ